MKHESSLTLARVTRPLFAIHLCAGTGEGPPPLAAFDAALMNAGVADHNLICLSSVIPPNSIITRQKYRMPPADYGRRLYVVMSEMRQSQTGRHPNAGVGWIQEKEGGRGLFVELHDEERERLEHDLHATLEAMRGIRTIEYGPVQTEISSRTCMDRPVCALVAAVYACEAW